MPKRPREIAGYLLLFAGFGLCAIAWTAIIAPDAAPPGAVGLLFLPGLVLIVLGMWLMEMI